MVLEEMKGDPECEAQRLRAWLGSTALVGVGFMGSWAFTEPGSVRRMVRRTRLHLHTP